MRLYEYEGKILFKNAGIRIPEGHVLDKNTDLRIVEDGFWPKVIKAQVLKGGRGKVGAITFPKNMEELRETVKSLLGTTIFNEEVSRILVEKRLTVKKEYYLSISYKSDLPVVIFSRRGGVDVDSS